jgi:DMSO/TMAO reductase YedYZ molybdopterin-dependent catalytic subunit
MPLVAPGPGGRGPRGARRTIGRVLPTKRIGRLAAMPLLLVLGLSGRARAQDSVAAVRVVGLGGDALTYDRARLGGLPAVEIPLTFRDGTRHRFRGPTLSSLLADAGQPDGTDLRGPLARTGVLIRAADGYSVLLSLADLDPALADRRVILATSLDGAPLPAREGPYRVVLEGDDRPPRWIRQVTEVRLVRPGD